MLKLTGSLNILSYILILIFYLIIFVGGAHAEELTGTKIMENVYNRENSNNVSNKLTFVLQSSNGKKKLRKMNQVWLDLDGAKGLSEKVMFFFINPPDIKDTAFLSWNYEEYEKDDEQWVYLPSLRKVRRIASSSKNDSFFGTEFSYADLNTRELDEDAHTLVKKEAFNEIECYLVESIPQNPKDAYSKILNWVDPNNWIILKTEYYDEKGSHMKTLLREWEKIQDIWTSVKLSMGNHQNGNKTFVKVDNVKYNTEIDDGMFNERTLKRGIKANGQ